MAITWDEIPNTAKSSEDSAELHFILMGGAEDSSLINRPTARALAIAFSDLIFDGLFRQGVAIAEIGPVTYECTITYGTSDKSDSDGGEGNFSWTFDTTGATKHVTHAISHQASYVPAGKTADNHNGIIGFKKNGDADGVDVQDRAFKWTETHRLSLGSFGFTYASVLGAYTGQVNSGTFRGKPAYTVLFAGASGGVAPDNLDRVDITYNFEYQPTDNSIAVGDISVGTKVGWDVASVCYTPTDETNGISAAPYQVDVDRVFKAFNFSALGIGTT